MNECFPRHMHTYHVLSRKTRNIVLSYSVVNYIYTYIYKEYAYHQYIEYTSRIMHTYYARSVLRAY